MLLAFMMLISFSLYSSAQTTPKAKQPPVPAAATKTAATPSKTTAAPVKKDGTPDMRYKTNQDAAKATPAPVHTKKDGTADKRYKENKKK